MDEQQKLDLLQKIFDNINNWLHFAEAKNAALIAFNIALIAVIKEFDFLEQGISWFSIITIGIIVSTICALWSFKPINKKLHITSMKNQKENLLHFAYIATLDKEKYIIKLYARYWGKTIKDINNAAQLEQDYCEEILDNAKIIVRKQRCFKIALYIDLLLISTVGMLAVFE